MTDEPNPARIMTTAEIAAEFYRIDRRLAALEGGAPLANPKPPTTIPVTLPPGTKITIGSNGATVTRPGYDQ